MEEKIKNLIIYWQMQVLSIEKEMKNMPKFYLKYDTISERLSTLKLCLEQLKTQVKRK